MYLSISLSDYSFPRVTWQFESVLGLNYLRICLSVCICLSLSIFCTFLCVLLSLSFSLSLHVCPYLYLSMSMTVSFYATSLRISIPFSVSDFVPVLHLSVCLLVYHKRLNLSIHICMPVYLSVCLSVCVCKIPIPPSFPLHSFPKDKDCA